MVTGNDEDKIQKEDDLQFDFTQAIQVKKADGTSVCGLKFVDFIVELDDKFLFIELKDPDNPRTPPEKRVKYLEQMRSSELARDLGQKVKDTLLFEWACDVTINKPIHYIVVIEASFADPATLLALSDKVKGHFPLKFPKKTPIKRPVFESFSLISLAQWNAHFLQFPAIRISNP